MAGQPESGQDDGCGHGSSGEPGPAGWHDPSGERGGSGAPPGRDPRLGGFAQHGTGDACLPGGPLAVLVEQVCGPGWRCPGATDDEVAGLLGRWAAVESWTAAGKLGVVREMIRRNARPGGTAPHGDLPYAWDDTLEHEVSLALRTSVAGARKLIDTAWALEARLPRIGQALAEGRLDYGRAKMIAEETMVLDEELCAAAGELILAGMDGCKTWSKLQRLAADAVIRVDPDGARKRREQAGREDARIRFWRETSGTCALAAYGLPADEALAANAHIEARAQAYRQAGLKAGIDLLRVMAYCDILNGIPATERITRAKAKADAEAGADAKAGADADAGTDTEAKAAAEAGTDVEAGADAKAGTDAEAGTGDRAREAAGRAQAGPAPEVGASGCPGPSGGAAPGAGPRVSGHDSRPDGQEAGGGSAPGGSRAGGHQPREGQPAGRERGGAPGGSPPRDDEACDDEPCDDEPCDDGACDDEPRSDQSAADERTGNLGGGHGGSRRPDAPASTHDGTPDGSGPGDSPGDGADSAAPVHAEPVLPARVNLTIPLRTLLHLADVPGEAHGLGPLDPALARTLAQAAARSPDSEFCVTVTSPEGYAVGHGCARPVRHVPARRGRQAGRDRRGRVGGQDPPECGPGTSGRAWPRSIPQTPAAAQSAPGPPPVTFVPPEEAGLAAFTPLSGTGPPDGYGSWTLTLPGAARPFTVSLGPVPLTDCDHRYESRAYQPGDVLRHLVQVRDGECTFPACSRHARETDFEHAIPYDQGGRTCGCNAGSRSRTCHQVKQSPGWKLTQPRPGWHQWTTPSGRVYTQGPWRYPA